MSTKSSMETLRRQLSSKSPSFLLNKEPFLNPQKYNVKIVISMVEISRTLEYH